MSEQIKPGSKISVDMSDIETLQCDITDVQDSEVLVSFWVDKSNIESA